MIDVKDTLRALRDTKRAAGIIPEGVLFTELHNAIMRQVRLELNQMCADGVIIVQNTLNDKSINLKE